MCGLGQITAGVRPPPDEVRVPAKLSFQHAARMIEIGLVRSVRRLSRLKIEIAKRTVANGAGKLTTRRSDGMGSGQMARTVLSLWTRMMTLRLWMTAWEIWRP